jgi:hypothetical protein
MQGRFFMEAPDAIREAAIVSKRTCAKVNAKNNAVLMP